MNALPQNLRLYCENPTRHPVLILECKNSAKVLQIVTQMAQHLFCKDASKPCGQCNPCKRIGKEIHPDVILLKEAEESTLKIEPIRELTHQMEIAPLEGGPKIAVLVDCQRLQAAASNALLKSLEEPGEGRYYWLLTSQKDALLPTILSRSIHVQLQEPTEAIDPKIVSFLEGYWSKQQIQGIEAFLESKESCLGLLGGLQLYLKSKIASQQDLGLQDHYLSFYEDSLALEHKLRYQANYGLLLEAFFRTHEV